MIQHGGSPAAEMGSNPSGMDHPMGHPMGHPNMGAGMMGGQQPQAPQPPAAPAATGTGSNAGGMTDSDPMGDM